MDLFNELINLPQKCVYGLFNNLDKKVYLGYTNNTVRTLYSNIESLKYSNKDINKLEFRVIESIQDSNRLKIRYQYWVSNYSNKGWGMYRNYKAIDYKLRIEVRDEDNLSSNAKAYIYVKLVSKGYKELIVGIFDDLEECNKFVAENYNKVIDIIYSNNDLTNEYRKSLK